VLVRHFRGNDFTEKGEEMEEFTFDLAKFIPYRDKKVCEKVTAIKREDICKHPNLQFKIRVIESSDEFYFEFALDIVSRIRKTLEEGKKLVLILPAGPIPQYRIAALIFIARVFFF